MGIRRWVRRDRPLPAPDEQLELPPVEIPVDSRDIPASGENWEGLAAEVAGCRNCSLCETRTRTVFGIGDRNADLLIIGEAPGADEDRQGEPFVGRAGRLLDQMLLAAGYERGKVYIANILKCRPPNNRNPAPEEVVACEGYLQRQVALVKPRAILSVGGVSATNLLQTDLSVGRLRGEVHYYGEKRIPLIVTYHPAYLLRQPAKKAKSWLDLQLLMRVLGGSR